MRFLLSPLVACIGIAVFTGSVGPSAYAQTTLVSVVPGGTLGASQLGGSISQVLGFSFTTTQSFTNVAIAANIATAAPAANQFTAFLTTQIGAGATSATAIATTTPSQTLPLTSPLTNAAPLTLFSGLTLDPGTYFVIITAPFDTSASRGWVRGTTRTVTSAPGVTVGNFISADGVTANASYAPASTFGTNTTFRAISITGAAVVASEPSVFGLFLTVFPFAVGIARRYRR